MSKVALCLLYLTAALWCSLFLDKEEDNVIRLSSLEDEAAAAKTAEQVHAVYKRFVNFHGELLLMGHWSILAYTGLVKILKKHHKRTGLLVRAPHLDNLLSQPFCSVEVSCFYKVAYVSVRHLCCLCCPALYWVSIKRNSLPAAALWSCNLAVHVSLCSIAQPYASPPQVTEGCGFIL